MDIKTIIIRQEGESLNERSEHPIGDGLTIFSMNSENLSALNSILWIKIMDNAIVVTCSKKPEVVELSGISHVY